MKRDKYWPLGESCGHIHYPFTTYPFFTAHVIVGKSRVTNNTNNRTDWFKCLIETWPRDSELACKITWTLKGKHLNGSQPLVILLCTCQLWRVKTLRKHWLYRCKSGVEDTWHKDGLFTFLGTKKMFKNFLWSLFCIMCLFLLWSLSLWLHTVDCIDSSKDQQSLQNNWNLIRG